jgi:hypothetical protein
MLDRTLRGGSCSTRLRPSYIIQALIDRAAHAVYIAAAAGGPMLVPDPFVLKLQS